MKVFDFDPAEYAGHYAEHGWVHIKNGQSPEFHAALKNFVDTEFGSRKVEGATIGGQTYDLVEGTLLPESVADSNAVECVVNGGALVPNECTINTRRGRSPSAPNALLVAPARSSAQSNTGNARSKLVTYARAADRIVNIDPPSTCRP